MKNTPEERILDAILSGYAIGPVRPPDGTRRAAISVWKPGEFGFQAHKVEAAGDEWLEQLLDEAGIP